MTLWQDEAWLYDRLYELHRGFALQSNFAADLLMELKYAEYWPNHPIQGTLRLTLDGNLRLQDLDLETKRTPGTIQKRPYFP